MNFFSTNELRPRPRLMDDGVDGGGERKGGAGAGAGTHVSSGSCRKDLQLLPRRHLSCLLTCFAKPGQVPSLAYYKKKVSLPLKSTLSVSLSPSLCSHSCLSFFCLFHSLSLCLSLSAPAIIDYATCPLALIISTQSQLAS